MSEHEHFSQPEDYTAKELVTSSPEVEFQGEEYVSERMAINATIFYQNPAYAFLHPLVLEPYDYEVLRRQPASEALPTNEYHVLSFPLEARSGASLLIPVVGTGVGAVGMLKVFEGKDGYRDYTSLAQKKNAVIVAAELYRRFNKCGVTNMDSQAVEVMGVHLSLCRNVFMLRSLDDERQGGESNSQEFALLLGHLREDLFLDELIKQDTLPDGMLALLAGEVAAMHLDEGRVFPLSKMEAQRWGSFEALRSNLI